MATATGTLTYTSSGKTYTVTHRVTYSISNSADKAIVTVTKIECKQNVNDTTAGSDSISHGAYDSTLTYSTTYGWITSSSYVRTTSYKTIWSGSKSFTTYKPTYATTVKVGYADIPISARTSYTITYNANGGSNAPSNTTKYYGIAATITSGKPSRTGYTFVNWLCSADSKYYSPSAQYSLNQAAKMTAQWTANKYTVSYNGNGSTSGTIASQTKTYGVSATFSDGSGLRKVETVNGVTREYQLTGWNTQPDGSGTAYALGGNIPEITGNLPVYAQWQLRYIYPSLIDGNARRTATSSITDTERTDDGEYIYITFSFTGCSSDGGTTYREPSCTITIDDDVYTPTLSFDSGQTTGTLEYKPSTTYSKDTPHNVIIELYNPTYASSKTVFNDYITTGIFPIDLYSNDNDFEVYMGIMHPYVRGVPLTLPDTSIDGSLSVSGGTLTSNLSVNGTITATGKVNGHSARKTLWTGTFNSGSIQVPDITKYHSFEVSFSGAATHAICFIAGSGTTGYLRGANSYCTAASIIDYIVGLNLNHDTETLTWVNCVQRTTSISSKTVTAISTLTISNIIGIE